MDEGGPDGNNRGWEREPIVWAQAVAGWPNRADDAQSALCQAGLRVEDTGSQREWIEAAVEKH